MSLDNEFDEFGYTFDDDFDDRCITAFAETVHIDNNQPDSNDPLYSPDGSTFEQFSSAKDIEAKFNTPSMISPSPSTDEGFPSSQESASYLDPFATPSTADFKQINTIRTIFKEYLIEDQPSESQTSCSNQSPENYLRLEREPHEVNRSLMIAHLAPNEIIQHEALSFYSSEGMMNSTFISSPECSQTPAFEEPWEIPEPQGMTMEAMNEVCDGKTANSRQSKYKNAYSLAVEQVQRLMKERLDLKKGDIKKYEDEMRKSKEVWAQENRILEPIVKAYESIDQECNNVKEKIKNITEAAKSRANEKVELQNLIRERDLLAAAKKGYQKSLTTGLQYKRLGLVSGLDRLVNDSASAFMKKDEFKKCLKEYPKIRTLSSMRSYFEENVKFGLIVARFSVDFLGSGASGERSMLINNSTAALKFWLVKSPMEFKSKKLFIDEMSRSHIKGEILKVYHEMEEKAKSRVSERELKQFYSVLNGENEGMSVETGNEAKEEGKRVIGFAAGKKEKVVKKMKKN